MSCFATCEQNLSTDSSVSRTTRSKTRIGFSSLKKLGFLVKSRMSSSGLRFCQSLPLEEIAKASITRSVSITPVLSMKNFKSDEKTLEGQVQDNHSDTNINPEVGSMEKSQEPEVNHPVDVMSDAPAELVTERVVACSGGKGRMSHPSVLINLDDLGEQVCEYCGQSFVLDENYREESEHDHAV